MVKSTHSNDIFRSKPTKTINIFVKKNVTCWSLAENRNTYKTI